MSLYNGLLLFDIAEPSINGWDEFLGYRGMMESWRKGDWEIIIQPYDAYQEEDLDEDDDDHEFLVQNNETGCWEPIMFGTYEQCKVAAIEYMEKH
jgi:hypothetical protein